MAAPMIRSIELMPSNDIPLCSVSQVLLQNLRGAFTPEGMYSDNNELFPVDTYTRTIRNPTADLAASVAARAAGFSYLDNRIIAKLLDTTTRETEPTITEQAFAFADHQYELFIRGDGKGYDFLKESELDNLLNQFGSNINDYQKKVMKNFLALLFEQNFGSFLFGIDQDYSKMLLGIGLLFTGVSTTKKASFQYVDGKIRIKAEIKIEPPVNMVVSNSAYGHEDTMTLMSPIITTCEYDLTVPLNDAIPTITVVKAPVLQLDFPTNDVINNFLEKINFDVLVANDTTKNVAQLLLSSLSYVDDTKFDTLEEGETQANFYMQCSIENMLKAIQKHPQYAGLTENVKAEITLHFNLKRAQYVGQATAGRLPGQGLARQATPSEFLRYLKKNFIQNEVYVNLSDEEKLQVNSLIVEEFKKFLTEKCKIIPDEDLKLWLQNCKTTPMLVFQFSNREQLLTLLGDDASKALTIIPTEIRTELRGAVAKETNPQILQSYYHVEGRDPWLGVAAKFYVKIGPDGNLVPKTTAEIEDLACKVTRTGKYKYRFWLTWNLPSEISGEDAFAIVAAAMQPGASENLSKAKDRVLADKWFGKNHWKNFNVDQLAELCKLSGNDPSCGINPFLDPNNPNFNSGLVEKIVKQIKFLCEECSKNALPDKLNLLKKFFGNRLMADYFFSEVIMPGRLGISHLAVLCSMEKTDPIKGINPFLNPKSAKYNTELVSGIVRHIKHLLREYQDENDVTKQIQISSLIEKFLSNNVLTLNMYNPNFWRYFTSKELDLIGIIEQQSPLLSGEGTVLPQDEFREEAMEPKLDGSEAASVSEGLSDVEEKIFDREAKKFSFLNDILTTGYIDLQDQNMLTEFLFNLDLLRKKCCENSIRCKSVILVVWLIDEILETYKSYDVIKEVSFNKLKAIIRSCFSEYLNESQKEAASVADMRSRLPVSQDPKVGEVISVAALDAQHRENAGILAETAPVDADLSSQFIETEKQKPQEPSVVSEKLVTLKS